MPSTPKSEALRKYLVTAMLSIAISSPVVAPATITLTSCSSSEATTVEETTVEETTPDDSPEEEGTPAVDPVANTTRVGSWVHWHNADLQGGDGSDDFNFGPNPYLPEEAKSGEYYDKIFRERVKKDTSLAAADMAWLDACVGTRYLGVFYEEAQRNWATTMNDAKLKFAGDQDTFYSSVDAFFRYLNAAKKVEIRECHGVTDQMYMNPFTPDGIPDIIVVSSDDQSGHELVYTFEIKGQLYEVAYRIECGFQPTNVSKIMEITPEADFPSVPEDPGKGGNTPQPDPDPKPDPDPQPDPDPKPDPDPDPPYDKDPEKAPKTNTEPNDVPGPGPSTNNGAGSNTSSADQPTNSTSDSYQEYKEEVADLAETNQNQSTGSEPSVPSTPAPSPTTHVDNNGDTGTSTSAPINTPTPVTPPATVAETGEPINSNPGEAWGGPAD